MTLHTILTQETLHNLFSDASSLAGFQKKMGHYAAPSHVLSMGVVTVVGPERWCVLLVDVVEIDLVGTIEIVIVGSVQTEGEEERRQRTVLIIQIGVLLNGC